MGADGAGAGERKRRGRPLEVRTNLPPGAEVVLSPAARGVLIRFFGDAALRKAAEARQAREGHSPDRADG